MPGPSVPLERYAAFLLIICRILDAGLVGFNFVHNLFVSGGSIDRGFLSQAAAGADGQAAFCFPATGEGVTPARLALRVIDA